jgi:glutathione S-transferase
MLKLYYNPGSCSLASHAALIEAGLEFEAQRIDLSKDEQFAPEYRAKNPWGRVPALEIDGQVLTENVAILNYISDLVPERGLLPGSGLGRIRALEWLALLSGTVHVSFRPIFRPGRLARGEEAQRDVQNVGLEALNAVLGQLGAKLGDQPYALGADFSFCDLYLFVFVLWSARPVLDGKLSPLTSLRAFGDRLSARPSVSAALAAEGLKWQRY